MANRKKELGVPRHSHCIMCGSAVPEKETLCSDRCKEEYEKALKRQRNMRLTAFLPIITVVIFFVVLLLLRK